MKTLETIPKIDLHCHLDGSVRPETLYELLLEEEHIKDMDFDEFKKNIQVDEDNNSLIQYLEKFKYPGLVMQTADNLERITYELMEDMSLEGVVYGEIRFAPYLHMEEGLTFDEVVESVIRGLNRGKKDFDIEGNLILIGMRHEPVEKTLQLVEKGAKYLNKGVVAIDLAGNEADFPPELHKDAIKKAKELGYKITIHAGETGSVKNIYTSIEELGTDRIGHGIAAMKDDHLMETLKERKIALELCPISNMQTKAVENMKDYPINKFLKKGIKVTVNTDNRTVSNTRIIDEFEFLKREYNLSLNEIRTIIKNSIVHSFASDKLKKKLLLKLE